MSRDIHKLDDVFGLTRDVPKTYTERDGVDDKFVLNLSRDRHVVVYGSSKQGKTCLRKNWLQPDDYIMVQCGNTQSRDNIYELILKEAGASVSVTESLTTSGSTKLAVEYASVEVKEAATSERKSFEVDPSEPNDVIRVLNDMGFKRFIILEDFHYLPEETQRGIAHDLKAFHERSNATFIIVGVWLEADRLLMYNGDLSGRISPVDADTWTNEDLLRVIGKGEELLNVRFDTEVKTAIVARCQNNVGLVQEVCRRLCEEKGVFRTQDLCKTIVRPRDLDEVMDELANEQAGRYRNFLPKVADGFVATKLDLYRWVMYGIVSCTEQELKNGLKLKRLFKTLQEIHPDAAGNLQTNHINAALRNLVKLQQKHGVKPLIVDYEAEGAEYRVRVVDGGLYLFLAHTPRAELLKIISCKDVGWPDVV